MHSIIEYISNTSFHLFVHLIQGPRISKTTTLQLGGPRKNLGVFRGFVEELRFFELKEEK